VGITKGVDHCLIRLGKVEGKTQAIVKRENIWAQTAVENLQEIKRCITPSISLQQREHLLMMIRPLFTRFSTDKILF